MEIITTEEVMDKTDMFQSIFGKNRIIWLVGFGKNFSRCRYKNYLHRVPRQMSNPRCFSHVSSSGESENEHTSQSDMENVVYNHTLNYGTCASFGSFYSFCINVYSRSYFSITTIQRHDK